MRKMNLKKIAAFVLAGTMAIGMSATAFADTGIYKGTGTTGTVSIGKTVTTDGNTMAPNTTFNFTVAAGSAGTYDGKPVYAGETTEGIYSTRGASFTPGDTAEFSYSSTESLTFDASKFSKPGIFAYTVSEADTSYEGVQKDTSTYTVYVYVNRNTTTGDKYIAGIVSLKNGTTSAKADLAFANHYGDNTNPDDVNTLTVTKTVAGGQADMSKTFGFTVKIDGASGEKYKVAYKVNKDSTEQVTYLTSGDASTGISIGNTGEIKVYGLSKNDSYTVTETDANTDGYTVSIANADSANAGVATGKITADKTVAYTNTKEAANPTGIIMNYAPYIAMLAAACVLAVVFFNRKREDA